jgi:hypothetical protein
VASTTVTVGAAANICDGPPGVVQNDSQNGSVYTDVAVNGWTQGCVNANATLTAAQQTPATFDAEFINTPTARWGLEVERFLNGVSQGTSTLTFANSRGDGWHPLADDGSLYVVRTAVDLQTPPPPPPPASGLPYGADSFFQSDTLGLPVDAGLTSQFHTFMATNVDQKATTWPKVNLNPGWSGENWIGSSSDPVWKLAVGSGGGNAKLDIVESQGVHLADKVWDAVPTGSQDRLLVVRDPVFGYTVQCADVVPNRTARTWTASNCGIFWHSSNGLDYRNPLSNDSRNISSRGRIPDAMQIPRSELDAAVAAGTGVGHVLHIFFVETNSASGFSHPMTGAEGGQAGFGGEGWRIGINRSVDLPARGLTGAALALARTLQDNGGYIGDNSGSTTQIKVGPPGDYTGTNLAIDVFKGKLTWADFVVYQPGSQ